MLCCLPALQYTKMAATVSYGSGEAARGVLRVRGTSVPLPHVVESLASMGLLGSAPEQLLVQNQGELWQALRLGRWG